MSYTDTKTAHYPQQRLPDREKNPATVITGTLFVMADSVWPINCPQGVVFLDNSFHHCYVRHRTSCLG